MAGAGGKGTVPSAGTFDCGDPEAGRSGGAKGNTLLQEGDYVVLGAEGFQGDPGITLMEIILKESHPWEGLMIKELDISRQTLIVMVRRGGKLLIPDGALTLQVGDMILMYTKKIYRDMQTVEI